MKKINMKKLKDKSMIIKMIIPGKLTDLNTYINLERSNKFAASKMKKQETYRVSSIAREIKSRPGMWPIFPISTPVSISYIWYCKDKRKDKSNISSMGRKFIEDGLVKAGIIKNDTWDMIESYIDNFEIDKDERCEVFITI